jgi:hypothetical protein
MGHAANRHYSVETNGVIFRVVKRTSDRDGVYWESVAGHENYPAAELAWRVADNLEGQIPKPWRSVER